MQKNPMAVHATRSYPFSGVPTFLRANLCPDLGDLNADIAVMGIPFDEGSPFMPGSRFGPRSIREHSLRFDSEGYYDHRMKRVFLERELKNHRLVDIGDIEVVPTDVEGTFNRITETTRIVLQKGAMPVVLGGDHSITFPVVRAFTSDLHVVQFDAHVDYAPITPGFAYTSAHAFRHINQMSNVLSQTQVGIRGLRNSRSMIEDSLQDGNRIVEMEEFCELGPLGLVKSLPGNEPCYVSIDIDVFDLPLVPGCVSAESNGMSYTELRDTLIALTEHTRVVGFDLVEVNPQLDVGTGITSYLAAQTVMEFLGHICDQQR